MCYLAAHIEAKLSELLCDLPSITGGFHLISQAKQRFTQPQRLAGQ